MSVERSRFSFEISELGVEIGTLVCPSETLERRCLSWVMPDNRHDELSGSRIYGLRASLLSEIVTLSDEVVELIRGRDNILVGLWWFFGGGRRGWCGS